MGRYHTFVVRIWADEEAKTLRAQAQDLENGEVWQCSLEAMGRTIAEKVRESINFRYKKRRQGDESDKE